uniref:Uncharacterized protein n=1 Tax=Moniliophthora roreri TaxID=221103 RepID=A0A0W0GC91_MONRR
MAFAQYVSGGAAVKAALCRTYPPKLGLASVQTPRSKPSLHRSSAVACTAVGS